MGLQRVKRNWATFTFTFRQIHINPFLTVYMCVLTFLNTRSSNSLFLFFIRFYGLIDLSQIHWSMLNTPLWIYPLIHSESCSVVSDSLQPHGLYSPWNSPGQNTGVGSLSLLQGFPIQGSNPGLPHCKWILYQLSHKGSPRILEWVAYPFSSRSSWPRNRTRVSCIAGGFFIRWATFSIGVIANQSPHKNAHLLLRGQTR